MSKSSRDIEQIKRYQNDLFSAMRAHQNHLFSTIRTFENLLLEFNRQIDQLRQRIDKLENNHPTNQ